MIGGIELKKLPILLNWLTKALIITIVPFFIGLIDNATTWKNSNGQIKNIFIS